LHKLDHFLDWPNDQTLHVGRKVERAYDQNHNYEESGPNRVQSILLGLNFDVKVASRRKFSFSDLEDLHFLAAPERIKPVNVGIMLNGVELHFDELGKVNLLAEIDCNTDDCGKGGRLL